MSRLLTSIAALTDDRVGSASFSEIVPSTLANRPLNSAIPMYSTENRALEWTASIDQVLTAVWVVMKLSCCGDAGGEEWLPRQRPSAQQQCTRPWPRKGKFLTTSSCQSRAYPAGGRSSAGLVRVNGVGAGARRRAAGAAGLKRDGP